MGLFMMGWPARKRRPWPTSTTRSTGSCIEVGGADDDTAPTRDTKNGRGAAQKFTPEEWRAFMRSAKADEFDDRVSLGRQAQASPLAYFLLELYERMTVDDVSQGRALKMLRFTRTTGLAFAGVIIGGAVLFGTAMAGGAAMVGVHPQVAMSLGAGGSALFLVTATFRAVRGILALFRALSDTGPRGNSPGGAAPRQDQHRPAA